MQRIIRILRCLLTLAMTVFLVIPSAFSVYAEEPEEDPVEIETEEANEMKNEDVGEVIYAESIGSSERSIGLHRGESKQLSYYLEPSNATELPQWNLEWAWKTDEILLL